MSGPNPNAFPFLPLSGGTLSGPLTVASPGLTTTGLTMTGTAAINGKIQEVAAAGGVQSAAIAAANILTPANTNGVAAQLSDLTRDYMLYLTIGTAGTALTVLIGPTSTPANTIYNASTATAGEAISFRLPNGWWWQWGATTATLASQLAIAC